jgi:23S rRNA (uracil1939-C5)-methyltransferase
MLARHDGVIVLVAGAIPGERVRAEVERRTKGVVFARAVEIAEASPARRPDVRDPSCGGMDYVHMAYAEQLRCKGEVIVDAFRRIGRVELADEVSVAGSPEQGYRLRARLHVVAGRVGFFREHSHLLCDAAATGQLRAESVPAVQRLIDSLGRQADRVATVVVAENVAARQRVLHLEGAEGAPLDHLRLSTWSDPDVTGVTAASDGRVVGLGGAGHVIDTARDIFGDEDVVAEGTTWTRQAASFFQANRFLLGSLARAVIEGVDGQHIVDLYAGVGLFAVALAALGYHVVAVEGDRHAARDLATNAAAFGDRLRPVRAPVEDALGQLGRQRFDAIVLDPPRTGVSPAALDAVVSLRAPRIAYVSCDPPTLARDSTRLAASGYNLSSLRAFDLFPNTAHVEVVTVWKR